MIQAGNVCTVPRNLGQRCREPGKIITGSFQGVLRIFFPHQRDYQLNDLMLEEELGEPILQVEAGRFLSSVPASYPTRT